MLIKKKLRSNFFSIYLLIHECIKQDQYMLKIGQIGRDVYSHNAGYIQRYKYGRVQSFIDIINIDRIYYTDIDKLKDIFPEIGE